MGGFKCHIFLLNISVRRLIVHPSFRVLGDFQAKNLLFKNTQPRLGHERVKWVRRRGSYHNAKTLITERLFLLKIVTKVVTQGDYRYAQRVVPLRRESRLLAPQAAATVC